MRLLTYTASCVGRKATRGSRQFFSYMAILAFAPGLQYRERKFTTPNGAAGPFLPGALPGAFPTARFRTILDIYLGLVGGVGNGTGPLHRPLAGTTTTRMLAYNTIE